MYFYVKHYYVVRCENEYRISTKVASPIQACLDTFGVVGPGIQVKNLGADKSKIQTQKWFKFAVENEDGWITMEKRSR